MPSNVAEDTVAASAITRHESAGDACTSMPSWETSSSAVSARNLGDRFMVGQEFTSPSEVANVYLGVL